MFHAYLDASALAKRYIPEVGSAVVDHLFTRVPADRMVLLSVGLAEVASILVRKRNAGLLPPAVCQQAIRDLKSEVGILSAVRLIGADGNLADQAIDLIDRHSINSTDAILLRSALDLVAFLRAKGDDLLLVTCDRRLLVAAQKEGLTTFNPETESESALDTILGP